MTIIIPDHKLAANEPLSLSLSPSADTAGQSPNKKTWRRTSRRNARQTFEPEPKSGGVGKGARPSWVASGVSGRATQADRTRQGG